MIYPDTDGYHLVSDNRRGMVAALLAIPPTNPTTAP